MRARVLLAIAVAAPACLFPSLDALTTSDGSVPDVSASDVITVDAADAAGDVTADAAAEGSCTDAAADASFCALVCPPPTFCDDFDPDTTFARWTDGLLTGSGTGNVQNGGISPPHQAVFSTKTIDAGTAFAEVRTQLASASVVTVDADVMVNVPAAHFGLFTLEFTAVAPYKTTRFFVDVSGSTWDFLEDVQLVDGGSAGGTTPISATVPVGWFHVTFTFDTAARTASLAVNGATIADKIKTTAAFATGNLTLRAGIYFVSAPVGVQKVTLDNVVVRAQ